MKKISNKNALTIILLIVIICFQSIVTIYATTQRKYLHIDEFYTYGLMQYKRAFIFENEDFFNEWHDKEYFNEYLVGNEENRFDFSQAYKNQADDVHPPIYYMLLKFAYIFSGTEFSIWPAVVLNCIFMILETITLFFIGRKVFKSNRYAVLLCVFNAVSISSIETSIFIRMYQLTILNTLLIILWHLNMENKELKPINLITLFLLIFIGFLTHYYYAIIVAVLFFIYIIKNIKDKNKDNIIKYVLTIAMSGILSIVVFPYSILHIFFGYRGVSGIGKTISFGIKNKIIQYIELIDKNVFNGQFNSIILIFLIILVLVLFKKIICKQINKKEKAKEIIYIILPTVIYGIFVILTSPFNDLRYLMPIVPLLFIYILYMFRKNLIKLFTDKTTFNIMAVLVVIFSIFLLKYIPNNIYTYKRYEKIVSYIESVSNNTNCIYLYKDLPISSNKIMEIFGVFTLYKQTYVIKEEDLNKQNLQKISSSIEEGEKLHILMYVINSEGLVQTIKDTNVFEKVESITNIGNFRILSVE